MTNMRNGSKQWIEVPTGRMITSGPEIGQPATALKFLPTMTEEEAGSQADFIIMSGGVNPNAIEDLKEAEEGSERKNIKTILDFAEEALLAQIEEDKRPSEDSDAGNSP